MNDYMVRSLDPNYLTFKNRVKIHTHRNNTCPEQNQQEMQIKNAYKQQSEQNLTKFNKYYNIIDSIPIISSKLRQKIFFLRNRKNKNNLEAFSSQFKKNTKSNIKKDFQLCLPASSSDNIVKQYDSSKRNIKVQKTQRPYIKSFIPPTKITAFSYIIFQNPNIVHLSFNSQCALEIASLTKIMTCYTVLTLIQQNDIKLTSLIQVGLFQSNILGTTAKLIKGQLYTLESLLYALMLPSGNDASLVLAIWGGRLIKSKISVQQTKIKKSEAINIFVSKMNEIAKNLGLKKTKYANPHGLINTANKSTAYDIAKLCNVAMYNPIFKKIVGTHQYQTTVFNSKGIQRTVKWQNTNKLLMKSQYLGIKTGMTTSAGPCLASCFKTINNRQFIIVVLRCQKKQRRFIETQILKNWILKLEKLQTQNSSPLNQQKQENNSQQIREDQD